MPKVCVEILPWISGLVDPDHQGRFAVDLDVQGERLCDLFALVAERYPNFRKMYDVDRREMIEMVEVAKNGKMVGYTGQLETRLEEGDMVTLLPVFVGG